MRTKLIERETVMINYFQDQLIMYSKPNLINENASSSFPMAAYVIHHVNSRRKNTLLMQK